MQGSNFLNKHLTNFNRKEERIGDFHHNVDGNIDDNRDDNLFFFSDNMTTFSLTFYISVEFEEQIMVVMVMRMMMVMVMMVMRIFSGTR